MPSRGRGIVEAFGAPKVASLVECWLETGRTQSDRVHLGHAGMALVDDPTMAAAQLALGWISDAAARLCAAFPDRRCCQVLGFGASRQRDPAVRADIPHDMADLIQILRAV